MLLSLIHICMGTGAEVVYLAVAHRGYGYIKRIKNGEGAGKVCLLYTSRCV